MEGWTEGFPIPFVLVRLSRYYCYRRDNQYSHRRDQHESNPLPPLFSPLHTNSTHENYSASITSSLIHPSRRTRWAISWCPSHSSYHRHYAPIEQCVKVAARGSWFFILFPLFQAMAKLPVLARRFARHPSLSVHYCYRFSLSSAVMHIFFFPLPSLLLYLQCHQEA